MLEELVPNDAEGRTWAELIAEGQIRDAVKGNVQAAREIADRTEGRARQAIEFEDKTLSNAFNRMSTEELRCLRPRRHFASLVPSNSNPDT